MKLFSPKKKEKGFTLIELFVVIAIIGLLAAITIPHFARHRTKAFDSTAISDLKNAATAQEAYYTIYTTYSNNVAALQAPPCNLVLSTSVNLVITAANNVSYTMTSVHSSSGKIFTLTGPGGYITP